MFIRAPSTRRAIAHALISSRSPARRLAHRRVRLGAEVLDDHLLDVAVLLVQLAQRQERLHPLDRGLADPDQDSEVKGIASSRPF